jgi:hypothetical protein
MERPFDGEPRTLTPTPHYYQIQGRAAEIARGLGSRIGGAEHLFLGMLHDGGWPVSVLSDQVDLDRAETAVLAIIDGPDYSPPSSHGLRFPVPDGHVQLRGAKVAIEMGDSYLGLEHALLAIIRERESVPGRALAGLADPDALEAAVLAAKNAPVGPPDDAVFLPEGQQMDGPLRGAIIRVLPEGSTFGFNFEADGRAWMHVFGPDDSIDPAVSRDVLNRALTSLDRPTIDG